ALRYQRVDTLVALGLAGLVNLAMLVIAARLFWPRAETRSGTPAVPSTSPPPGTPGRYGSARRPS
ncbi:hypothetical protein ACWEOZ_43835, partial [Actinoplanes sp. NPDC004185]